VVPSPSPNTPNTKIRKYGYVAEIILSKNGSTDLFHYVIQRDGSSGIVHWGQELSFQRAMECVEEHLESLRQQSA
jgi:hypothetical protein